MLDAQENQPTAFQPGSAEYPQPTVVYGRALRTIGQDLTELFPKILEIKVEGVNFIAAGQSHPDPFRMRNLSSGTTFWRKLIGKNVARVTAMEALTAKSFERIYSPAEIDRLDLLYRAGRAGQVGRADSYSLAERLRVMGNIIDRCRGRLERARKNADNLFVDYWDQKGEFKTARLTTVIMYRNDQDPSVSGAAPKQLWEGYDF